MNKKLFRSRDQRIIAGVCGGLGEYFDIDPVIIRVIFLVTVLLGGAGVLLYLILWLVIPEEGGVSMAGNIAKGAKKQHSGEDSKSEFDEVRADLRESYNEARKTVEANVHNGSRRALFGMILIVLGVYLLLGNLLPSLNLERFIFPAIVIGIGLGILLNSSRR